VDGPGREPERVTQALHSLVGRGTAGLRGRPEVGDEAFVYYGGHFAHQPRSAAALGLLLADFFGLPVRVLQFQGHWLYLERDDQARLPVPGSSLGCNNRLGHDVVVGERVWGVQSKFRIRLGPLTYPQFRRLMPQVGDRLRPVCQMTRSYVGPEFLFDVQLLLHAHEVPTLRLGEGGADRSYLGWNTWVRSVPFAHAAEDAVFAEEG
jgi:type VI secretion system protein ImpH